MVKRKVRPNRDEGLNRRRRPRGRNGPRARRRQDRGLTTTCLNGDTPREERRMFGLAHHYIEDNVDARQKIFRSISKHILFTLSFPRKKLIVRVKENNRMNRGLAGTSREYFETRRWFYYLSCYLIESSRFTYILFICNQ